MIAGVGIDSVDIERFANFADYPQVSLEKTFCATEIVYCRANQKKSPERFAARFAAKEAFYKALCAALPKSRVRTQIALKHVCIQHQANGHVVLHIDWNSLAASLQGSCNVDRQLVAHLSLTHTKTMATAIVVLEHKSPQTFDK